MNVRWNFGYRAEIAGSLFQEAPNLAHTEAVDRGRKRNCLVLLSLTIYRNQYSGEVDRSLPPDLMGNNSSHHAKGPRIWARAIGSRFPKTRMNFHQHIQQDKPNCQRERAKTETKLHYYCSFNYYLRG